MNVRGVNLARNSGWWPLICMIKRYLGPVIFIGIILNSQEDLID